MHTADDGRGLAAQAAPSARAGDERDRREARAVITGDPAEEVDEDGGDRSAAARDAVHLLARDIAARLAIVPPRARRRSARGTGEMRSVPYRGGSGDLDLDRTLEAVAERRPLTGEDVFVREPRRRGRAIVLAVDVSGSMREGQVAIAAATVGALTAELVRDELAVLAFWSDAALLVRLEERTTPERIVDALLSIEPRGLTNVAFPLELAEAELRRGRADREQRVLLLSDCVHNAGPDPREAAARLPRLDVLFEVGGECDPNLARDLARIGRGIVAPVRTHADVAPALSRMLSA